MTKLESVVAQALELDETDRELLVIQVSQSLTDDDAGDRWSDPALIAELEDRSKYNSEHPESMLEWDVAEKVIFEGLS